MCQIHSYELKEAGRRDLDRIQNATRVNGEKNKQTNKQKNKKTKTSLGDRVEVGVQRAAVGGLSSRCRDGDKNPKGTKKPSGCTAAAS